MRLRRGEKRSDEMEGEPDEGETRIRREEELKKKRQQKT